MRALTKLKRCAGDQVTRKEQTVRKLITLFAALMLIGCANGNNQSATMFALDSTAAFPLETPNPQPVQQNLHPWAR